MLRFLTILIIAAALAACRRATPEEQAAAAAAAPPAAAMAPTGESVRLDDRLARLQLELRRLLDDDLDAGAEARLLAAEAMTDRLLEAEPPVQWLASDYSVDARLRQLQALADRIIASLRRDAGEQTIRADVRELHARVIALRRELAQPGGGPAPPPLDSLLARVRMDAAPAEEGAGGE